MSDQKTWDEYDAILKELGRERTRENWLWIFYNGQVPEDFDNEDELALPPDLRINHAF